MERELDEQIEDLINKSNKDLRTRIMRIVMRQHNKILKDHARELKNTSSSSYKPVRGRVVVNESTNSKESTISKKSKSKYHSDSESDYYSE